MSADELRGLPLFQGLDDDQLAELADASRVVTLEEGEEVWAEGTPADGWWVLLDGRITLSRRAGAEETVLGAMSVPGQWAGAFGAWDPHSLYFATGRTAERTRVLSVPAVALGGFSERWFPFGVHFIRGLVDTVRRVEATARQRDSLVALGTLAAGLAHEINNPASAATRAVDSLHTTSDALVASLGRLASAGVTAEQLAGLDGLRRALDPASGTTPDDALALADREDELSDWLADHDVDREWELAPVLAAAGATTEWCEHLRSVLAPAPLGPAVEWVAETLTMTTLLGEVKDATHRISGLIGAVRSYSQLDRAAVQRTDVREGLDSTLVMLAPKLKGGVEVVREYADDVPEIEAIPGELNQVWTNLIDNAVDAMDGRGTLHLTTRTDGPDRVVVEVTDTGPGMPSEVQARAFEPFYTTKDVGKGTGLGLDISRRIIVERHSGEIEVDSRPGRTVMRVVLPVRGPDGS